MRRPGRTEIVERLMNVGRFAIVTYGYLAIVGAFLWVIFNVDNSLVSAVAMGALSIFGLFNLIGFFLSLFGWLALLSGDPALAALYLMIPLVGFFTEVDPEAVASDSRRRSLRKVLPSSHRLR